MFTLVAALVMPIQGPAANPALSTGTVEPTPIRITMNNSSRFGSGDRVRVQVETADDGYLVVLRVDTEGRIRVLFPIDPDLDPFVRGGRVYELRGRADRQTFVADEHNGTGVIYAAVSREPMKFRDYSVGDHWDYEVLRLNDSESDPEAELSRVVSRMTDNGRFDYDIVNYTVTGPYIASVGGAYPATVYGSYGGYDPYWNCLGCRWGYRPFGFGMSFGVGGRYSPFYDPWNYSSYYDPFFYDPYYYGYGYGYYNYPGSYWRYPGQSLPYTVINLPRPRIPNTEYGLRSRVRPIIPVLGGDLTRQARAGAAGGRSAQGGNGDRPTAGRYAGDRARQPVARPSSGNSEPTRSSSPPQRVDRSPPSSSGSGAASSGSSGSSGTRSRSRGGGDAQEVTSAPQRVDRPSPSSGGYGAGSSGSAGTRARSRGGDVQDMMPTPRASINRRSDEPRPVFREPPRQQPMTPMTRDNSRQDSPRPVYREPPRVERSSPPQQSAPRVERSSPPPQVTRSGPPQQSAPARSSGGGGSSSPPRSRQGGGGH